MDEPRRTRGPAQPAARRAAARAGRPRRGRARRRGPAAAPAGRRRVGGERPQPARHAAPHRRARRATWPAPQYGALGVIGARRQAQPVRHRRRRRRAAPADRRPADGPRHPRRPDPRAAARCGIADLRSARRLRAASRPNHPPMRRSSGVPVRVRDAVFGNLYLTREARRRGVHRARRGRRRRAGGRRRRSRWRTPGCSRRRAGASEWLQAASPRSPAGC